MSAPTDQPNGPGLGAPTGSAYAPSLTRPPMGALAVAALVVAFFSGLAGLIMGIVARRQIRRDGTRGDGLAVAAIAIGAVRLVLEIGVAAFLVAGLATGTIEGESSGEAVASVPTAGRFAPGTCAASDGATEGGASTVSCSGAHVLEVVGTFTGDLGSDAAAEECSRQVADHAADVPEAPPYRADAIPMLVDRPNTSACVIIFTDGDVSGSVVDGIVVPAS